MLVRKMSEKEGLEALERSYKAEKARNESLVRKIKEIIESFATNDDVTLIDEKTRQAILKFTQE